MLRYLLPAALVATPLAAEPPRTVTDIAPVQGLVASVMGDLGSPEALVPSSASPHDHALSPSEARALQQAELLFWIGPDLSPGLGRKIDAIAGDTRVVALGELPQTRHLAARNDVIFAGPAEDAADHEHDHEHDHDHAEDDHDHEDGHDHHHGTDDPHLWLSPENARAWLGTIADELAEADPEHADTYRANAGTAQTAIDEAVARATESLAPAREARFVVFHDAYQYFERTFDLDVVGAVTLSDASAPSPASLSALRDAIRDSGARCVFAEPQFDPRLIDAVTEGSEIAVAELDPLGSDIAPGADFYPSLIDDLATRIADCTSQ